MHRSLLLVALMLSACDRDRPPAPSAEQAARLDDAEAMLNSMADNEEGPEAKAPDPSTNTN